MSAEIPQTGDPIKRIPAHRYGVEAGEQTLDRPRMWERYMTALELTDFEQDTFWNGLKRSAHQNTLEENVSAGEKVQLLRGEIIRIATLRRIDLEDIVTGKISVPKDMDLLLKGLHTESVRLAIGNIGLLFHAYRWVRSRSSKGATFTRETRNTLLSSGFAGLLWASKSFNPWIHRDEGQTEPYRFSGYVIPTVRRRMQRELAKFGIIELPFEAGKNMNDYVAAQQQLRGIFMAEPAHEDVVAVTLYLQAHKRLPARETIRSVIADQRSRAHFKPKSDRFEDLRLANEVDSLDEAVEIQLRKPVSDTAGESFEMNQVDNIPGEEDPVREVEYRFLKKALAKAYTVLSPKELRVLQLRYGLTGDEALTLEETGVHMGLTRNRIRQIEAVALSRLRDPKIRRELRDYCWD